MCPLKKCVDFVEFVDFCTNHQADIKPALINNYMEIITINYEYSTTDTNKRWF